MAKPTDEVREFARRKFVEPARQKRASNLTILAGDVHRGLRLTNRVPLVCQALTSRAFLEENHLELVKREGPPSGQSTTVVFTYRFTNTGESETKKPSAFLGLRGIAKQVFESVGGGEAFLRGERDRFNDKP
jgi:5-methylcytosine-specific restriction protein B